MSIVNVSKPTTSLANETRINIGETWASDLNQWQNESRTWAETISVIDNTSRTSSSITNIAKP